MTDRTLLWAVVLAVVVVAIVLGLMISVVSEINEEVERIKNYNKIIDYRFAKIEDELKKKKRPVVKKKQ